MNGNDAWRAVAELAASQHGAFHRDQAASHHITARQLRSAVAKGTLWRPLSDVFVFASHHRTFRQRCVIASLAGGAISHSTAARLHGLDGFPDDHAAPIEVSFPRSSKRRLPGYFVHTWSYTSRRDITVVDAIRCTSVARTLVQLGLNETRETVERALDSALRNGVNARWIEETLERLRRRGPTGYGVLAKIIADPARSGALTESVLETLVERAIADPDLPTPTRQHQVAVDGRIRRFDLAFPDARLAIECHSRKFHFDLVAQEKDNLRDFELAAEGWEIMYVTWGMAHRPALFLRLLKRIYRQRRDLIRNESRVA